MKRKADGSISKRSAKRRLVFETAPSNMDVLVDTKVKKALAKQADRKWINLAGGPTNIDYAGAIYNLQSGLSRGDQPSAQFDGSSIKPLWLQVRYRVVCSGGTYNSMRIIIGQMLRDSGSGPATVGALLNSVGSNTAPLTGLNQYAHGWYRILSDELVTVCAANNIAECREIFIPGRKMRSIIMDSTPAPLMGGLFMIAVSDDGATTYPTLEYESNLIYND